MRVEVEALNIVRGASLIELRELRAACEIRINAIENIALNEDEKKLLSEDGRANLVKTVSMVRHRTGFGLFDCKIACEAYRNGSSRK